MAPLAEYLDLYRQLEIDMPYRGQWAKDFDALPYALKSRRNWPGKYSDAAIRMARQAFYALCTHIDHQLRLVIGMLREEGLIDNTIVLFTCDHGDMLGNHGLWAKAVFYEDSAHIPMILMPTAAYDRMGHHATDDRLTCLADVMPTLLDLCGIPIPDTVEGASLASEDRRDHLYGEHFENDQATRMIHDGRHKLIYYAVGNRTQLFDLQKDPTELTDVADDAEYAEVRRGLTAKLVEHLYGDDREWLDGDQLVGLRDKEWVPAPNRAWSGQRGWRFM
jgi:arylsulfatase A-like enzyme